jgi:hypothetical protein
MLIIGTLSAYAQAPQPVKMTVGSVQMTPVGSGYYNAIVMINLTPSGLSQTDPVYAPWFQVQMNHVKTAEEATATLYDPVSKYLTELQTAAEDLKHPPN